MLPLLAYLLRNVIMSLSKSTIKMSLIVLLAAACGLANAANIGPIHTTQLDKNCFNMKVSTKVGYLNNDGKCDYKEETTAYGSDECTYSLNGPSLKAAKGTGYTCAATHTVSGNDFGEALDEFNLTSDAQGNYVSTSPSSGSITLKK